MFTKNLQGRVEEIRKLMEYAVPGERLSAAVSLLEKHGSDAVALNLFQEFYSYLPESREDVITVVRLLQRREGIFLVCVTTLHDHYLYAVSSEEAVYLGTLAEGIWEEAALSFFGFADRQGFLDLHTPEKLKTFSVYVPVHLDQGLCPFCAVSRGELHVFGCPAEICPWCGGHLTQCPCRYEQMDRDTLDREKHVDILQELATEKGRIPFEADQRPAYPAVEED